ncbi:MAG: hypothetical protein DME04_02140 [Candidatus Rokuibacteriota bacterium]|nr:MAG: hypothetical protein DME04_02140 [Candidatus Rokubacteria bacterium]
MRRSRLVLGTMALTVAVWVGPAGAAGPGDSYGAQVVGTVRFLDRAMNLLQLADGTELRTTDSRLLRNIREGMRVKVDFTHAADLNELNSIEPVGADVTSGASPTTLGEISNHS